MGRLVFHTYQVIINHHRYLYTWNSIGDGVRNSILHVKGYPGADYDSDHIHIVTIIKLRTLQMRTSPKKTE